MRIFSFIALTSACILLSSCASMNHTQHSNIDTHTANKNQPPEQKIKRNPLAVSFYTNSQTVKLPYKVIGEETISKFNGVGIKRQEAIIHDRMRLIAASMGGDAIVNIKRSDKTITGTVIAYQSKYDA